MKSKAKNLVLIFVVLNLIAAGVYSALFLSVKNSRATVSEINIKLKRATGEEENLRSIGRLIRETEGDRELLRSYVVSEDEILETIQLFESLGSIAGVALEVDSVDVEDADIGKEKFLSMRFSVSGEWEDVHRFLSLVESAPRALVVSSTRFDYINNSGSSDGTENEGKDSFWKSSLKIGVLMKNEKG